MKIHSKDHDYYDTVNTWKSDVHWNREKKDPLIVSGIYKGWYSIRGLDKGINDKLFLVGFCGKIYTGIIRNFSTVGVKETYEYFETKAIETDKWLKYFKETPIFIVQTRNWGDSWLIKNPILKNWGFYKVKDAFTAHQEIEQYLTNELASQEDPSDLKETEQQILERHGFTKCTFKGKHTGRKLKRRKV